MLYTFSFYFLTFLFWHKKELACDWKVRASPVTAASQKRCSGKVISCTSHAVQEAEQAQGKRCKTLQAQGYPCYLKWPYPSYRSCPKSRMLAQANLSTAMAKPLVTPRRENSPWSVCQTHAACPMHRAGTLCHVTGGSWHTSVLGKSCQLADFGHRTSKMSSSKAGEVAIPP